MFMAGDVFQYSIVLAMMSSTNTMAAIERDTPNVLSSNALCLQRDTSLLKAIATGLSHVRPQRAGRNNKVLFPHINNVRKKQIND